MGSYSEALISDNHRKPNKQARLVNHESVSPAEDAKLRAWRLDLKKPKPKLT
jgi:hypothetical protein